MPLSVLKLIILQLLVWIWILPAYGQHKAWQQYTIDDGLSGNEVFDVLQDKKGFLWFVTDQGICKFNGYEFIRPVDTSAFVGNEAFTPTEDKDGRIWFARLDKTLWVIENDTVRPWEYNHVLNLYKEKFGLIDHLGVDENQTIWIALRGYGLLVVDSIANHKVLRGSEIFNILFTKVGDKVISATQFWEPSGHKEWDPTEVVDVIHKHNDQFTTVDKVKKSKSSSDLGSAWPLRNEDLVFSYGGEFVIIRENAISSRFETQFDNPKIFETPDGKILVASYLGEHPGFFLYESISHFEKGMGENILPGYKVCDILVDREGGWWAATLDGGVFYCKNPDINIYDKSSGFPTSNVVRLTNDGSGNIYASLEGQVIWKINSMNDNIIAMQTFSNYGGDISALYYDTSNNRLWASPLKVYEDGKWREIINPATGFSSNALIKKFSPDPEQNGIWMSTSYGFFYIENQTLNLRYFKDSKLNNNASRTFAVVEDRESNIWVATIDGLKIWKDDHYINPSFSHPVLRYQARDIELMSDGRLIIAFRGGGILIHGTNGNHEHLTKKNGLSSDFITKVYATADGIVYACTNEGLNQLTYKDNQWNIEVITTKQGLPSNLINDVSILNGELWVATEKGLGRIRKKPAIYRVTIPTLERFKINNRDTTFTQHIRLPYDQNNIILKYYSLHFQSEGQIQYRYRLLNADTAFTYTRNREVSFPNLASGKYNLEVQAQNTDGTWSDPANWSFEIRNPWWFSLWFILLSALLIAAAVGLFIHYRLQAIKKKAAINDKIKDLELAALRAQMNPHFIFNCLGSIQQFIMENDSASATRYLARFAKLIRLALHSSVDGKHSLAAEVEMLDNYLALEQMRFKEKFSYSISTSPDILKDEVYLSPMLVQPFVENAILHGMKNKMEGGWIHIDFEKKNNDLLVSITDNGPGFSSNDQHEAKAHKSFGMSLTKKRLHLLTNFGEGNSFAITNLTRTNGEVAGSKVSISIPLE